MTKYLGVDWGEKRIGLSLANEENLVATPFKVVNNISQLVNIINQEGVDELIIGLPKKLNSSDKKNDKFDKFIEILQSKIVDKNLKINFVDERYTSVQADGLKDNKMKIDRDCVSAMIILQTYLDRKYDKN